MAPFEFGWIGLLLVTSSGGLGAGGLLPLLGIGPESSDRGAQLQAFVVFFVILLSVAAVAAMVV